jgi:thermostable 8-oxoguanine DNA glycosylase
VAEARREAEEKRDAKYAKMERQREEVRQTIREKVNTDRTILSGQVEHSQESSILMDLPIFCLCTSRDQTKHAIQRLNCIPLTSVIRHVKKAPLPV